MSKRKSGKTKVFLGAMGLFSLCLSACAGQSLSDAFYAFKTGCEIKLYDGEGAYLDELSSYFEVFSGECDNYDNYGDGTIYQINLKENEGKAISVSEDLAKCLYFAKECQRNTNGLFNPLIGNLSKLWKEAINPTATADDPKPSPYIPSQEQISAYVKEIEESNFTVDLDNFTVTRTGTATLDLGGVAKGYALRHANEYLSEKGVTKYQINLGRSSQSFGLFRDGSTYDATAVDENGNKILTINALSNISLAVSGSTEQKAEIDGEVYTHIINPKTGEAKAKYDLVVVAGSDPAMADVISTTMMLADEEEAAKLATDNSLSYLIYKDGKVLSSSGLRYTLP